MKSGLANNNLFIMINKIAVILYTQGLDYDDRIRKEILSIMKLYPNISFKIFAIDPKNREEESVSSYGVPYRIPYLKSRDKYASATHTVAKTWDFYKTVKNDLKEYDVIWCADIETFVFTLLLRGKRIVWDLHELPSPFIGNPILKALFRYIENRCAVMIHANESRLKYLQSKGMIRHQQKQYVLRNYPMFDEIDTEYDDLYCSFDKWVGESKCVYMQGLAGIDRADIESIGAVLSFKELKGVVVGWIQPERMKIFEEKFGKELLQERIFFAGQIKQLKTPQFIKRCFMSLVFYKNSSPNNWYCEPNRLFQSLINGIPAVVGNNPTMKEIVGKNHFGICIDTDGSDLQKIINGINYMLNHCETIVFNLSKKSGALIWDNQENVIKAIVNKLCE